MTKRPPLNGDMTADEAKQQGMEVIDSSDPRVRPDWNGECDVCGQSPILPLTGMCGPCTFGEAETVGGNW